MIRLELSRTLGGRRRYALGEIGILQLGGLFSRSATATAGGLSWTFTRRGFLRSVIDAVDDTGVLAGSFTPRSVRRGGAVRWDSEEYTLRGASTWRERYALTGGDDRELAILEAKGWGKRPVSITIEDPASLPPGLLLFAAFVVHGLAEDASSAAVGGSTGAAG